jgi:hypothetical protein
VWPISRRRQTGPAELYRLSDDIAEREDVSARYPEKKRELIAAYERLTQDLPAPVRHSTGPDVD